MLVQEPENLAFQNLSSYCASKFGMIGLTESVAKEIMDNNVKVMVNMSWWSRYRYDKRYAQ